MVILPNSRPSVQRQLILDQVRKEIKNEVEEAIQSSFAGHETPVSLSPSSFHNNNDVLGQRLENFELQLVPRINRSKQGQSDPIKLLHIVRTIGNEKGLEVHFFSHKKVIVDTYEFFEWLLYDELDHIFHINTEHLDPYQLVEYGYYQGHERVLGIFRPMDGDDFSERMPAIILSYARFMLHK
jgi:hypothetical protein